MNVYFPEGILNVEVAMEVVFGLHAFQLLFDVRKGFVAVHVAAGVSSCTDVFE